MLLKIRFGGLLCSTEQVSRNSRGMPGSIHISATQPPATALFLLVGVGKREYSGNIEQDSLSIPVTSLRESMVIMLYNADKEPISKTELNTKTIVESGTTDVVFTLDSGEEVILQLQFLLNDDDRKRIQEMRNSAMKRNKQELLGDVNELNFQDSPLSKRLIEKISSLESKQDQIKLQKTPSVDGLQDKATTSGISVDPLMKASKDLLLQTGGGKSEDPDGSKKRHSKPESKSSSAVKNMINAFESTSSQGILRPETLSSGRAETGKATVAFGDKGLNSHRPGKQVLFLQKPSQNGVPYESWSRWSSGRDGASKQKVREHDLSRSKRRKHRHSIGRCSLEQLHSSRGYLECPLNNLVATSNTWLHPHVCVTSASRELRDLLELENLKRVGGEEIAESTGEDERGGHGVLNLNGWLINQGMRAAIVVIACGVVFLNSR